MMHGLITLQVQQWYACFDGNQQLSNWTLDLLNEGSAPPLGRTIELGLVPVHGTVQWGLGDHLEENEGTRDAKNGQ